MENDSVESIVYDLASHTWYAHDSAGNVSCAFCGYYRDFTQRDGKAGKGSHKPECLHRRAKEVLATLSK